MRIQLKVVLFAILFSAQAFAEQTLLFYPYFPGMRLERGNSQNLEIRSVFTSGVGILVDKWYGSVESGQFEDSNSEGNVSIKRNYQDLSLWGGYSLHEVNSWNVLGQVGVGLFKERVKTRVGGISDSDTSEEKSLFGLGVEALYSESSKIWTVSVGGRFYWGEGLDPNPQPGIYLKLGFQL